MAVARQGRAGVMRAAGLAAALIAAMTTFGLAAQPLPALQEFYFDTDPAAVPMVVVPADSGDLVDQLMKQRERGRKALDATVQLAGVAFSQGRPELGRTLYAEASSSTQPTTAAGRAVRWNYGWSSGGSGQRMLRPPAGISKSSGSRIFRANGSTCTEAEDSTVSAMVLKPIQRPV